MPCTKVNGHLIVAPYNLNHALNNNLLSFQLITLFTMENVG
jgi:hypothetical protein